MNSRDLLKEMTNMEDRSSNVGGRPPKYKKLYNLFAYELCLLGATDKQIAEALEISEDTVYEWKKKHRGFSEALRKGKIKADALVAKALFKRALGFRYNEVTFEKIDGKINLELTPDDIIVTDAYRKKIVTKYVAPDTGAAMSWLKNRQKELWRDKQTIEFENMTDEQLDQIINRLTVKANDSTQ